MRSVENATETRPYIKTSALFSRDSTDIYADMCTIYGSSQCPFPQFADGLENIMQPRGLL